MAIDRTVRVAAYQGPCREGDISANLAAARSVIEEARRAHCHFLVFPECFLTGDKSAEAMQQGARALEDPELRDFIKESADHDTVVLAGLARRSGGDLFNSVLVIHRGRLLGRYDQIAMTSSDRERPRLAPGTGIPVFEAHGVRFGVVVSADSANPQAAMSARLQGVEILFSPHYSEIPSTEADAHRRWVRHGLAGLACQLNVAVVRADVVKNGRMGQVSYGDSFVLSPQGEPLAEAGLFKTGLIHAEVTPDLFRRPNVWGDLHDVPAWLDNQLADLLTAGRPARNETELRAWLTNMVVFHHYQDAEISTATGLAIDDVRELKRRWELEAELQNSRGPNEALRVLPYPGGRHPRLGFFDGAVAPRRETKVSVFTPWLDGGYVVVDVPEAIFSNLGLIFLAHTHIPTLWDQGGIKLPPQEWSIHPDGRLSIGRVLPNNISFGTEVIPGTDDVRFALWLRNGTRQTLTGLRVQNCVMLGRAAGFTAQSLTNKLFRAPVAAAASADGRRWILTHWERCGRVWGNEQVPCIHSDPVFPDCEPGETVRLRGWLSFYEGTDIGAELQQRGTSSRTESP